MQIRNLSGDVLLEIETLCKANLRGANLCGANLCGANLCEANLRGANLRGANLCGANLRGADLRGTDLCETDLCETDLYGANLYGAYLEWQSHELLAEILRQNAQTTDQFMVAGYVLIMKSLCWGDFLKIEHPQREWALGVLKSYGTEKSPFPY